ncbi:peptidoglycan-binding domain-containing protein [Shewanella woodyi]|uniref:Peptidoglycan-binding domain 1 protein n=1 Tax=Shewanella woodyi (strain ATCC 51908 / MS32) TaxID=392500 RepID=B1KG27_SHEWM|nr:peptidoglycan-binding domain-containing protein [Shewanella woodyi]ACA86734.1 Peptidoglycan-binding domain 1 protein [Shewanella woodyi ATCC 51908]
MMNLRIKSSGEEVKSLQELLTVLHLSPGPIDGEFGDKTEDAVLQFQEQQGLYADGVVGTITWNALKKAAVVQLDEQNQPSVESDRLMSWQRVAADPYQDGYNRFYLREDAAKAYLRVYEKVKQAGGLLTSSGARRALNAEVNPSRSATSFHYTGRALDLFVGSGMKKTKTDPFIISSDGDRLWRVYARAEEGEQMDIEAITYDSRQRGKLVTGRFVDLTSLFKEEGFERIRARRSFFKGGSWLGAEWWHFQYEEGLEKGKSTFGNELLKVYREQTLNLTPVWQYRHYIFGDKWN